MAGNLPAEIEHLFELNTIDFSDNDVAGNIPSQWSSLNKLSKFASCEFQHIFIDYVLTNRSP